MVNAWEAVTHNSLFVIKQVLFSTMHVTFIDFSTSLKTSLKYIFSNVIRTEVFEEVQQ